MSLASTEASSAVAATGAHLMLFDGVCGLCNRLNRFVLDHDRRDAFRFAPLQGEVAERLLARYGRRASDLDTFYIVADYDTERERLLSRGRAALFVAKTLRLPWSLLTVFAILPTFLLDFGYDFVASRRYRWFGQYDTCPMPRPGDVDKFLDAA